MSKCYRCQSVVPDPDITEAINREIDWRESHSDEDVKQRVLICVPCADELEDGDAEA